MASEDDLNSAYESGEEDYYSDGGNPIDYGDDDECNYTDADYHDDDDDDDDDNDNDNDDDDDDDDDDNDMCEVDNRDQPHKNYTILNEEDIRKRQEDAITRVSTLLSVSKVYASILLRNYHWRVITVHEEWFADEIRVREKVGLLLEERCETKTPIIASRSSTTCGICFEPSEITHSAACCDHRYCRICWGSYIGTSIKDGPGCLLLRCPDPDCNAAIDQDMIDKLAADEEDKERYSRYLFRSYVEDNRKTKWCPSPGCEFAVEFVSGGDGNYDVFCLCSYRFCWNCNEESHRPVDCATVSKWLIKNSAESENMNWILVNSKSCPKCRRPIEKNQGCMHMTCSAPCKFEFCWLCLGAWSAHGQRTGGFYACNTYSASRQEGTIDEAERRREMAKQSLEKYLHYYERWATNQSSRKKALADLHVMQTQNFDKLSDKHHAIATELKVITDAWLQVIECRRILKWTYAYGYYQPENEHAKKEFFEYLQGHAESGLERLHQCAEQEVQVFIPKEETAAAGQEEQGTTAGFYEFLTKLSGLTNATKNLFENLVSALENGLSDVYHGSYRQQESAKDSREAKKGKGGRGKGSNSRSGETSGN